MGSSGKSFGAGLGGDWRNDVFGTTELSNSAQDVAMQRQRMAQSQADQYRQTAQAGFDKAALMSQSPQQLQALTSNLATAQKQADSDQKLMDAIDPAVMEASKQALSILQGGGAASQNPLMASLNNQRTQLVNSLREQYGPGAETSAIGQNALRQFDLQANQASVGSLGNLFGMMQQGSQTKSMLGQASMGGMSQAAQGFGQYGMQGADTQLRGTQMLLGGQQMGNSGLMDTVGANQVATMMQKGQQQAMFNKWSDSSFAFGEAFGGMGMGSAKGGGGGGGGSNGGGSWGGADANQMSAGTQQ